MQHVTYFGRKCGNDILQQIIFCSQHLFNIYINHHFFSQELTNVVYFQEVGVIFEGPYLTEAPRGTACSVVHPES